MGIRISDKFTEISTKEAWLYKNKKALSSMRKGLKDAADGKISKLHFKKHFNT